MVSGKHYGGLARAKDLLDYWPWGLFVGAALFLGVELYLGEWHADTREAWGEYLAFEKTVGPNGDGMTEV